MSKSDRQRSSRPPAAPSPPLPASPPAFAPAPPVPLPPAATGYSAPAAVGSLSPMAAYVPPQSAFPTASGGILPPTATPQPTRPVQPVPSTSPRPISIGSPTGALPSFQPPAQEELPSDIAEQAVKSAPPFLVSMLVHMLLVIVLALITFSRAIDKQLQISAVYAEKLGQQLLDDKLQSPESLDMKVESPALTFDRLPADDPLAAPPKLEDFFLDATKATSNLDAPNIGLALTGREVGMKKALLPAYGGNATTEGAVLAALEWLKKQQMKDGGWSVVGPYPDGAIVEDRCAATAMALLAFQGYGATHKAGATTPDFHDVVDRGWNFLLKMQDKDGVFMHDGTYQSRSYAQAQATIAVCEIYGMTKDDKFKKPAQLALDFAHKAQSPELGGWRYHPREDSDTSVTGWYVMAFQSGLMAGLDVQSPNLEFVNKFLDRVALEDGTRYAYQIDRKPGAEQILTMTAEALLCRQYLGWKHDDRRLRAGVDFILANPISFSGDQNVYYWYYATQVCHHMDGADWSRWNDVMRQALPAAQIKTGPDRGSWSPVADRWGSHGGRLFVTCLSTFMLETYYRHLPIYKWRLKE